MNDVFEIFDLPRQYVLDLDDLQHRMIQLSAARHPDRFSDPIEQAEAAERIAAINHAYAILKDPARRAEALLNLIEHHNDTTKPFEAQADLPPDFLMQVMEIRELLEQALEQHDHAKLDELRRWAENEKTQHLQHITMAFDAHLNSTTTDTTPDGLISQVGRSLNILRYLDRMLQQIPD